MVQNGNIKSRLKESRTSFWRKESDANLEELYRKWIEDAKDRKNNRTSASHKVVYFMRKLLFRLFILHKLERGDDDNDEVKSRTPRD
jgi:hypothetical protein